MTGATDNTSTISVAGYLLKRLKSLGVDHVFGVPGDFILPFFEIMADSDIMHVASCNELNAGYAADGYARIKGLAAAAVTYGPGSFSIVNAVAGAYAEDVPLVVISGGPATSAYQSQAILHHLLPNKYAASLRIFEQVTAYTTLLDKAEQAATEIDKALSTCLAKKKPVFLEIPTDIQLSLVEPPQPLDMNDYIDHDKHAATQAARRIADRINQSKRTVLLPGHEIHRWGLQDKVIEFVQKTNIAFGSVLIGKADYMERLPLCVGAYQGAGSQPVVREFVEDADTVVFLGMIPSDFNLGGFTDELTDSQVIHVWNNQVKIDGAVFDNVSIADVIDELLTSVEENRATDSDPPVQGFLHKPDQAYQPEHGTLMTSKRFYDRIANFLRPGDIVLGDAGCAVSLAHLQLPENSTCISSCYWASIGMGFGAALGACFAADEGQRIIALEGDGSFQMTAQELSNMQRYGKSPIIFVVNNAGYTAERLIHDGPFNDIPAWKYHKLPEAFGGGLGIDVHTEGDLEAAIKQVEEYAGTGPILIEVHMDPYDASEAFRLMSEVLRSH